MLRKLCPSLGELIWKRTLLANVCGWNYFYPRRKEFYLVLLVPPSQSDFLNPFQEVLELANAENKETLITGDFNFDFLDASSSNSTKDMKRILSSFNLKQLIDKATRITKESSTLLDLFATNSTKNVTLAKVIPST